MYVPIKAKPSDIEAACNLSLNAVEKSRVEETRGVSRAAIYLTEEELSRLSFARLQKITSAVRGVIP